MTAAPGGPAHLLETERLVLHPADFEHLADLHRLHSDPFVVAAIFDGRYPTLEETRDRLLAYVAHWRLHGFGYWMAYPKGSGREEPSLVGRTGLKILDRTDDVEVAHCFFQASSGKGYAVEAARAAIAFGFRHAGLERIVCVVRPANARSLRVAEKLGFRCIDDRWHQGRTMRFFALGRSEFLSSGREPSADGSR